RRWVREVAGPLDRGDDERLGAVTLLAAVEEVQRLDDPPRRLVLLERDRLLVEPRSGVRRRVFAIGDRDPPEVLTGRAVLVHAAGGEHRHPLGRGEPPGR